MNRATHVASSITSFGSILAASFGFLGACTGPRTPSVPAASPLTIAVGREGGSLRGVAGDGTLTFAAITIAPTAAEPAPATSASTVIEGRRGDAIAWTRTLAGGGGPIATTSGLLVATLTGSGQVGVREPADPIPTAPQVRGERTHPAMKVIGSFGKFPHE